MTKINEFKRLGASNRRLIFEVIKYLGIFYFIENILRLNLKEPWNTLYKRAKKTI